MGGAILEQAVKVQRCRNVSQAIVHIDNYIVAFGHTDRRNRPLIVDSNDGPFEIPIRVPFRPSDIEIVCDGGSMAEGDKEQQRYWSQKVGQREGHDGIKRERCIACAAEEYTVSQIYSAGGSLGGLIR